MTATTHVRVLIDGVQVEDRRDCGADVGIPLLATAMITARMGMETEVFISSEEVYGMLGGAEDIDLVKAEIPGFNLTLETNPDFWA